MDEEVCVNCGCVEKVPYVRRNYTKTTKIRTVIREEPVKLAQYIRGKTPKFEPFFSRA